MPTPPTPPSECLIYAYLTNLVGVAPSYGAAALLITSPNSVSYNNTLIRAGTSTAYCDYTGEISVNVIESTTYNFRYFFQIQYTDDNGLQQISTLGWAQVPNQDTVDLSTLTFYPTADALFV